MIKAARAIDVPVPNILVERRVVVEHERKVGDLPDVPCVERLVEHLLTPGEQPVH